MSRSTQRLTLIFDLLAQHPYGLRLSDIAKAIDSPKSSLVPVLKEFCETGYLMRSDRGHYQIGGKWRAIAGAALAKQSDGSLDLPSVMGYLMEEVRRTFHAHGVAIFLWDQSEGLLRPFYNFSVVGHHTLSLRPGEGIAGQVWEHKKSIVVKDYMKWEHALTGFRSPEWRAHMAVVLSSEGKQMGVLVVRSHNDSLVFEDADLTRLEKIVANVSRVLT